MSTPKAARRKNSQKKWLFHWAHAGALCANVIVVEAFVFAQDANARAFGAAQTTCYCRPSLDTPRVTKFPSFSHDFFHSWFKSFKVRPHRPILFVWERSACEFYIVGLRGSSLSFVHI